MRTGAAVEGRPGEIPGVGDEEVADDRLVLCCTDHGAGERAEALPEKSFVDVHTVTIVV